MLTIYAKNNEPFEITLKRFKKKCEKAAILSDIKKHQAYEKPSEARKRKENSAKRKALKLQRKMKQFS